MKRLTLAALAGVSICLAIPASASAFCGFYVSGADASLYNNATMVVLMREGQRTVLSMRNNYEGPPEDFAMVIPVPQVLQEENVQTLPEAVFTSVDRMAAPRLVEYWEDDPCAPRYVFEEEPTAGAFLEGDEEFSDDDGAGVRIEAQFEVGEYDIVVLSAEDSTGLDTWLRANNYNIPEGAEPYLRPYVQGGMYFFVAQVNVERVTFEDGQAMLSPLRFHYDSDDFSLPIRLGLINANGAQDLLVHILANNQRYEVANYPNATIPTNITLHDEASENFGSFYNALFDRTISDDPSTVVTEYSWDASTCDPCPGPTLTEQDFLTLGADVMPSQRTWGYTLTRLHARYTAEIATEDLVFRTASPIFGGRGTPNTDGVMSQDVTEGYTNMFQGRYAILHWFEGDITCDEPERGYWGDNPSASAAENLAFTARDELELEDAISADIDQLGISARVPTGVPAADENGVRWW